MANTYTDEQKATLLKMLEFNLSLIFDFMDAQSKTEKEEQLMFYIDSSIKFIEIEGINIDYEDIGDLQIITMYAAYLYDKRNDGVSVMPRALRYAMNIRVLQQKVNENA